MLLVLISLLIDCGPSPIFLLLVPLVSSTSFAVADLAASLARLCPDSKKLSWKNVSQSLPAYVFPTKASASIMLGFMTASYADDIKPPVSISVSTAILYKSPARPNVAASNIEPAVSVKYLPVSF